MHSTGNCKQNRQPSEWEKIFANEETNKGLISKICKQPCSSISKKQTTQSKNRQKRDFPGGTEVKNPPANAGDTGSSPGPGRFPHATEQLSPCATTTEPVL